MKKMRSNKSKEFFAELKVLCKIHHINVVSDFDSLHCFCKGNDFESFRVSNLFFRWSFWGMLVVMTTYTWFMSTFKMDH